MVKMAGFEEDKADSPQHYAMSDYETRVYTMPLSQRLCFTPTSTPQKSMQDSSADEESLSESESVEVKDSPPSRRRLTFSDHATNETTSTKGINTKYGFEITIIFLFNINNRVPSMSVISRYTCRTSPVMIDLTVLSDDSDSGSAPIPSSKR